jgi:hypothetical protein
MNLKDMSPSMRPALFAAVGQLDVQVTVEVDFAIA